MEKEKAVIFGASKLGLEAFHVLKNRYHIEYYCDNDNTKWGTTLNGVEIISPMQLGSDYNKHIIITSMFYREIEKQLRTMGYNYIYIYYGGKIRKSHKQINLGHFLKKTNMTFELEDMTFFSQVHCYWTMFFFKQSLKHFLSKPILKLAHFLEKAYRLCRDM